VFSKLKKPNGQFPDVSRIDVSVCDVTRSHSLSPTLIDMADNRQQTAKKSKGFRNRLKKAFGLGSQSTHQSRSNSPSDVVALPVVGAHPPVPPSPPVAEPPTVLIPLASPHPLQKQDQSTLKKLRNCEPNIAAFVSLLSVERMLEKRHYSSGCATQLKIRAFTTRTKTW